MRASDRPYPLSARLGIAAAAFTLAMALILSNAGCASLRYSHAGQAADIATTAIALGQGAVESNPLIAGSGPIGMLAIGGFKLAMPILASKLSFDDCKRTQTAIFGVGAGAAIGNLAVIAGAAASAWPIAIPAAIVTGIIYAKKDGARRDCVEAAWRKLYADYAQKYGTVTK